MKIAEFSTAPLFFYLNNYRLMTIIDHKDIKLSTKVQQVLFSRGYSHIFNWEDYRFYKNQTKTAIFRAEAIADLFVSNTCQLSDFAEYEF